MAIGKQVVEMPFVGGLDTKSDEALVSVPSTLGLKNALLDQTGIVKKRWAISDDIAGTDIDGNSITLTRLRQYKDQLVGFDGNDAYVYREYSNRWYKLGFCPLMQLSEDILQASLSYQGAYAVSGIAYVAATKVYAVRAGADIYFYDSTTRTLVNKQAGVFGATEKVAMCVVSNIVMCLHGGVAGLTLTRFNTAVAAFTKATASFAASCFSANGFDMVSDESGFRAVVVNQISTNEPIMSLVDSSGTVLATASGVTLGWTTASMGGEFQIAIKTLSAGSSYRVGIVCADTTTVPAIMYHQIDVAYYSGPFSNDFEGITNTTTTWLPAGTNSVDSYTICETQESSGEFDIFVSSTTTDGASNQLFLDKFLGDDASGAVASQIKGGGAIIGRAFLYNSNSYFFVGYDNGIDTDSDDIETGYLMHSSGRVVARFLPDTKAISNVSLFYTAVNGSSIVFACGRLGIVSKTDANSPTDARSDPEDELAFIEIDFSRGGYFEEFNDVLVISSGLLWAFDGESLEEFVPIARPKITELDVDPTAGGLAAGETYTYVAAYHIMDAQGRLTRSLVSEPSTITITGANQVVYVHVTTLQLSTRLGDATRYAVSPSERVIIQLYRTTDGGSTFYSERYTLNDPDVSFVVLESTVTDANLTSNPILYTDTGELANAAVDYPRQIAASNNRLLVVGNDNNLWASKLEQEEIRSGFSSGLRQIIPSKHGKLSNVGISGSQIVCFCEEGIYRFYGDGPNDLGIGAFSTPELIHSNIGHRLDTNILHTDRGIIFQSNRGLWRLAPSLGVEYIGAGVESFVNADSADIVDLVHVRRRNLVLINISGSSDLLVLDTLTDRWSTLELLDSGGAVGNVNAISNVNVDYTSMDERLVFIVDTDIVFPIDYDQLDYTSEAFYLSMDTPWYKLSGIEGFYRLKWVYLLGRIAYRAADSSVKLNVDIYYDYEDTKTETVSFTLAGSAYTAVGDVVELRLKPQKQKATAIRFKIYEDTAGTDITVTDLIGLRLMADVKRKRPL